MMWRLSRVDFTGERTIGALYADDNAECITLEDPVRIDDPATAADEGAKVPGATAIAAGTYKIVLTPSIRAEQGTLWSPMPHEIPLELPGAAALMARLALAVARGERLLPQLLDVHAFTGVRMHAGNRAQDVAGCIAVGRTLMSANAIGQSRDALVALMAKLVEIEERGEENWLTITNDRREVIA